MHRLYEEFSRKMEIVGEQCDTALTVRHEPTGDEKSIVIPAQELTGKDWGTVFSRYWDRLMTDLGYVAVAPPHYSPKEFRIDYILTDNGEYVQAVHVPSGMSIPAVKLSQAKEAGFSGLVLRDKMMVDLIQKLIQAGIPSQPPQPPSPLRKKVGRPRWPKEKWSTREAASEEDE